jgi:hypothetical protein
LSSNKEEQAFNYLIKAQKIEPNNIKLWETILGIEGYKKDPLVIEIKKLATEKIKQNPTDLKFNKLKSILKEK